MKTVYQAHKDVERYARNALMSEISGDWETAMDWSFMSQDEVAYTERLERRRQNRETRMARRWCAAQKLSAEYPILTQHQADEYLTHVRRSARCQGVSDAESLANYIAKYVDNVRRTGTPGSRARVATLLTERDWT